MLSTAPSGSELSSPNSWPSVLWRRQVGAAALEVDRRAAEDREPQEAHGAGDEHHADDELLDRAPAADPGDEHADERRPRDPPGPVEDRPARQPLGRAVAAGRGGAGGHLGEVAEVVADRGGDQVEDEDRRPGDEHDQRQHARQHHVDVREPLDAVGDARHRGADERDREHHDDADEQHLADGGHPVELQPGPDLQCAEAQRSGRSEQRREDRQDVDELAEAALGVALTQQGRERGADQLPTAAAERRVGDGEPDDGVDRPRVQGPVEERGGHGDVQRLRRPGGDRARRRAGEVRERLGDAVEHQPDAHARAEHHRDPRDRAELGPLVVGAERDLPVTAERHPEREHHETARDQDERPSASGDDGGQHGGRDARQRVRSKRRPRRRTRRRARPRRRR